MRNEILSVKNLTYEYQPGHPALDQISLSIGRGEKIAVMGSNGAGKSTFFLNLNGVAAAKRRDLLSGKTGGKERYKGTPPPRGVCVPGCR